MFYRHASGTYSVAAPRQVVVQASTAHPGSPPTLEHRPVLPRPHVEQQVLTPNQVLLHASPQAGTRSASFGASSCVDRQAAATPPHAGEAKPLSPRRVISGVADRGRAFAERFLCTSRSPIAEPGPSTPRRVNSPSSFTARRWKFSAGLSTPNSTKSRTSTGSSPGPRTPGGSRLSIHRQGLEELTAIMRSKDRMRQAAERPFRERGLLPGGRLGFEEFVEALTLQLREWGMSIPGRTQMQQLYVKFRREGDGHDNKKDGMDCENYESLLFRLLCFLRASSEVQVDSGPRVTSEERDKHWREEFIQKNPLYFHEVYEMEQQLGKGSFGTCHMVRHRTQRDVDNQARMRVCKIISKVRAKEARTPESKVREEFAVLKQLDHPHVLRIFEDFEDENNFYLVMEACRGGDLQEYVKSLEPMDAMTYERWVAKVMHHTLSAIAYCHSKGVIHKDLKPENVMLSTEKHTPVEQMHVVIVDFGLSEMFLHPDDRSKIVAGTPPYMAPEVWKGNSSKSCDIWSVGVMLFYLLSGRLPFMAKSIKEFLTAVQVEPDYGFIGGATDEAVDFCRSSLEKQEEKRPTAQEALKHCWFDAVGLCTGAGNSASTLNRQQIKSLLNVGKRTELEKFVTRFVATQLEASEQINVNEAFLAIDCDGDGMLSLEEMRDGFVKHLGATPESAEEVARELDVGGTGKVSYTEFLAGVINLRSKRPEEQDKLLWLAWQQFMPDESGIVKASHIKDALAARGMTVADLPDGFLAALTDRSSQINFQSFKELLLQDSSGSVMRTLAGDRLRGAKLFRWLLKFMT